MKTFLFLEIILFCCITSCNSIREADNLANKSEVTIIYPKEKFNKEASENHLAEGTSGIKGVLFTKEKSLFGFKAPLATKIYGINKSVLLFPVSDYFKSWYELRSKKENKKTRVYMSDEAFAQRFETTTDNFGRFNFEKLKPGKYFLQAFMELTITYNKEVNTGTGYTNFGSVNYYENRKFYKSQNQRIEKFVEITEDGEIIEVKLK